MLLNIKISKDNIKEVHLHHIDDAFLLKVYDKGKLIKAEVTENEETALNIFDKEDIGETY